MLGLFILEDEVAIRTFKYSGYWTITVTFVLFLFLARSVQEDCSSFGGFKSGAKSGLDRYSRVFDLFAAGRRVEF